jgi:hypothetical protein
MLMKKALKVLAFLAAAGIILIAVIYLAKPLYYNWGATEAEIGAGLPGDEFVPSPKGTHTVGITIQAAPDEIYPWLVQLGAEQGGYYSYTWIEGMIQCNIENASSIHPEWQARAVGDRVKFCPGDFGPPAYTVAALEPDRSMILGHSQEDGAWSDTWQFVLVPVDSQSTRLLVRTRTVLTGGIWSIIDPGALLMEYGMLHGIRDRAEG